VTFDGRTYTWSEGTRNGKIEAIDPTKKPRSLDYKITDGDDKDEVELAIYELDGDTFRDCIAPPGKDRPKEFSTESGTGYLLITYKRVK